MKSLGLLVICSAALSAHPMGNFSVNHYSKLQVTARGIELQYVLDLAEIPTFELLHTWNIGRTAPQERIDEQATQQSREWLNHLSITANGLPVKARLNSAKTTLSDGAGGLPIARVDIRAHIDSPPGVLKYEDGNFPERAGWREIVLSGGAGASLLKVSQSDHDISKALTQYPPDPTVAPPQEVRAELLWKVVQPHLASREQKTEAPRRDPGQTAQPVVAKVAQPHIAAPAPSPATLSATNAPAGSVVRGDFLSRLLYQRELTTSMLLLALAVAFGLGALHAFTPGHGKTIVAAYLVGSRGTLKHAAFLGAMVTFTHTITVFALGLATLFFFRYIVPEKMTALLGAVSGLSIVAVGALMLYKRISRAGFLHSHGHSHTHMHGDHHHEHPGDHLHTHGHSHSHADTNHYHDHGHHHHGGHNHSHVSDEITWGGLVALGTSGGLVPCESALLLLLGAIALGRVGLGLLLLVSFSLGLASVLMIIGVLVLYAKKLLPESTQTSDHPFFRWVSIASPAVVMIVGLLMTAASLGWQPAKGMPG